MPHRGCISVTSHAVIAATGGCVHGTARAACLRTTAAAAVGSGPPLGGHCCTELVCASACTAHRQVVSSTGSRLFLPVHFRSPGAPCLPQAVPTPSDIPGCSTDVRAAAAAVPPACLPAAAASAAAGSGPLRDRAMLHPSACAASGGFAPHGTLSPHLLALLPEYPAAASALLCAPFSGPQVWTLLLESSITAELRHVAFTICQQ